MTVPHRNRVKSQIRPPSFAAFCSAEREDSPAMWHAHFVRDSRERRPCHSSRRLLVTLQALLRGWRRRIQSWSGLHRLVVTVTAPAMERLLVSHDCRLCTAFKLDLRNLRQQLRLGIRARMAIATDSTDRIRVFLKQICRQSSRAIRRPRGFVWRVLERLSCRLRRVVTLDASDQAGTVGAPFLSDVIEVVELNRSKLRIRSQRDHFRRLLSVLS